MAARGHASAGMVHCRAGGADSLINFGYAFEVAS